MIHEAEQWMSNQTIRNVERLSALLAPGWSARGERPA
jgi:hypothetical protein